MAKYSEEEIIKIVKSVIASLEHDSEDAEAGESIRVPDGTEEEMATAGYAETLDLDSSTPKTYKSFNSKLCIAIGDELLKGMLSISEAKSIIRALESFVNNCQPDFYVEKLGEYSSEDLARYTINWFKLVHSAVKLRDALQVSVTINEAPTADFLEKYNEKGHLYAVNSKHKEFQAKFNENLDEFRNGKLSCNKEEMGNYNSMVLDELTAFCQRMTSEYDEAHRAYLVGEMKRCIDMNKLLMYVDPDVIRETRNSDAIILLDGDNETVLYTLGE